MASGNKIEYHGKKYWELAVNRQPGDRRDPRRALHRPGRFQDSSRKKLLHTSFKHKDIFFRLYTIVVPPSLLIEIMQLGP
eukprot:9500599-Pyramimonas_sp.AAC.1